MFGVFFLMNYLLAVVYGSYTAQVKLLKEDALLRQQAALDAAFDSATLALADFACADVRRASFRWSTLTDAVFQSALVEGADFNGAAGAGTVDFRWTSGAPRNLNCARGCCACAEPRDRKFHGGEFNCIGH